MATSSAKPAKLLAYSSGGLTQVQSWETEVTELTTALENLRTALAGASLPDDLRVFVPYHETWFDALTRNQRHLDEWVGDVAEGFIQASGGDVAGLLYDPDMVLTVDDSAIRVGYADRRLSEEQAREDAEAIAAIIGRSGLYDPEDPESLEALAELYPELRDILDRAGRFADDGSYASMLVSTLGPRDVRTLVDLTNSFGVAQDNGLISGAYDGYVVPLATFLGLADRSGHMDEDVRQVLHDLPSPDDVEDGPELWELHMQYRATTLLLAAGTFSPQTTADMAGAIINGPVGPEYYEYEAGFTDPAFLDDHRQLASNQWVAFDALADSPEAANLAYGDRDTLEAAMGWLVDEHPSDSATIAWDFLGGDRDDLRLEMQQTAADSVRGGLLEHPLAAGTLDDERTTGMVTAAIEIAGDATLSDPMRGAVAQVSTPYTVDLASTLAGGEFVPDSRLPELDAGEIGQFMREVSEGEQGRLVLAQNAAALVSDQVAQSSSGIAAGDDNAFGTGSDLAAAYYTELGESWNDVQLSRAAQHEAFVAGWHSLTDPVVELVSGKIVERIPLVSTVSDLPLAKNVVDGITNHIESTINGGIDGVLDRAFPAPELEAMTTWRDRTEAAVEEAVATPLWDSQDIRRALLDDAVANSYNQQFAAENPDLWRRITAGEPITEDEFRSIPSVWDVVHTQAGKITDTLQAEMGFNAAFDEPPG